MFEDNLIKTTDILLKLACKFFAVKLNISDEEMKNINISSVQSISGAAGICWGIYDDDGKLIKIDIHLKLSASAIGMVDVLAHEMVHAKQHLDGEFSFVRQPIVWWLPFITKEYMVHNEQILAKTPYYEQVCEQKAFSSSRELTRQFLNFVEVLEKDGALLEQKEERFTMQYVRDSLQIEADRVPEFSIPQPDYT